jgi:pimeloyl-ACP methyl ester carboxylesterase
MYYVYALILLVVVLLLILAIITRIGVWRIERAHPPIGEFATVNATRVHYLLERAGQNADLPPIVFLHGASGNLADQAVAFRDQLKGRADLLFVDRPGHGWSSRGPKSNELPDGQADTVAALLDHLEIPKAIIVGHSFGGAITVTFAMNHPDKTIGTVYLAPVSHPWPGGISWYYHLTALPLIGRLFSETLALPVGMTRLESGTASVFTPNMPVQDYLKRTGAALVLRPDHFRANAIDVARLLDYVSRVSPRYSEIGTPAVVITGDKDAIVLPRIHSLGLHEDLQNIELVWIGNLGHKPDYIGLDLAIAGIEKIAGLPRDLQSLGRALQERIADDNYGPVELCLD